MGRPADRTNLIVRELRGQILTGELAPGGQLPTRVEIERSFGASPATVQRALEELRRDGFVQVQGRQGTFVSPHPPHLTRYAITFPISAQSDDWPKFWSSLKQEVVRLEKSFTRPEALELPIYSGLLSSSDSPDFDRLLDDIRAHRVAGLIFMSPPNEAKYAPLLDEPGIPRVAIMQFPDATKTDAVWLDQAEFRRRAAQRLAQLGRRRVAILDGPNVNSAREWAGPLEEFGLETRPFWHQTMEICYPVTARSLMHLMFQRDNHCRPDALIIADDNLLEDAAAGLVAAGISTPEELDVVAHCNFPWPVPVQASIHRLGFDVPEIVAACVAGIDRQRAGGQAGAVTRIVPRFEDELPLRGTTL